MRRKLWKRAEGCRCLAGNPSPYLMGPGRNVPTRTHLFLPPALVKPRIFPINLPRTRPGLDQNGGRSALEGGLRCPAVVAQLARGTCVDGELCPKNAGEPICQDDGPAGGMNFGQAPVSIISFAYGKRFFNFQGPATRKPVSWAPPETVLCRPLLY